MKIRHLKRKVGGVIDSVWPPRWTFSMHPRGGRHHSTPSRGCFWLISGSRSRPLVIWTFSRSLSLTSPLLAALSGHPNGPLFSERPFSYP